MRIDDPARHWDDYVAMVPSVRLPTSHSGDDLIRVWLRLPPGGKVDVRYLVGQSRYALTFPPGTRSDRVEYLLVDDHRGERGWTAVDVRGTTVEADGSQRFHVLRPVSAEVHAPLAGWSWPRGDATAQKAVDARLKEMVQHVRRPQQRPPMDAEEAQSMVQFNQCAECHRPKRPRARFASERDLERGTDAMGFFVPQAVVQDRCVVANHRPRDLNSEDPFVAVTCSSGTAQLHRDDDYERYVCPGDDVPVGTRDVRAALHAGHEYTQRMCASRRYLYQHMTEGARAAFARAFEDCGIP